MSVTGFPTGIKLGGSAPAGETSDGKIYIYDSSDNLVATITFNGNFTIPDDVTLANETSGFSITQHSVKLTVSAASTLAGLTTANVTGGFTMAQNSKTVTIKGSPTISDETSGFSIADNSVTLIVSGNSTLAGIVSANESHGFSITQNSVKLAVESDATLANGTTGFTLAQNSATLTVPSDVTFADGTTGFTLTQNGATLTVPQDLDLTQATAPITALTTITCSNPGTPDYDITDLTNSSPYGFASADEGQTVLTVIKNLQTRLAELESKLQTMGLLAT